MKKVFQQLCKFIGISGIGWILDFIVFNIIVIIGLDVKGANIVSSLVGVCFVFVFSTKNTFQKKEKGKPIQYKFAFYIAYQLVLINVISLILQNINILLCQYINQPVLVNVIPAISKIIVTPITMITNFIVMKILIEKI